MLTDNRTPAHNSGLAKVAVQCSADTFVVNRTLVLRINIGGESRHLRQAANRYHQWQDRSIDISYLFSKTTFFVLTFLQLISYGQDNNKNKTTTDNSITHHQ